MFSPQKCEQKLTLSPEEYSLLLNNYHVVEKETGTFFLFEEDTKTVSILGSPESSTMAQSFMGKSQSICDNEDESSQGTATTSAAKSTPKFPKQGLTVKMDLSRKFSDVDGEQQSMSLSPGAESHDSCYDSDGSPHTSRRSSCARLDLHDDVTRTGSNTLDGELSETDVTPSKSTITPFLESSNIADAPKDLQIYKEKDVTKSDSLTPASTGLEEKTEIHQSGLHQSKEKIEIDDLAPGPPASSLLFSSGETSCKIPSEQIDNKLSPKRAKQKKKISRQLQEHSKSDDLKEVDQSPEITTDQNLVLNELELGRLKLDERTSIVVPDMGQMDNFKDGGDISDINLENKSQNEGSENEYNAEMDLLEFGIKLGYSEDLIRKTMERLGPSVEKNELLNELVEEGGNDNEDEDLEDQPLCPWPVEHRDEPAERHTKKTLTKTPSISTTQSATNSTQSNTTDVLLPDPKNMLRPIILDGSNIAMSHGNKEVFSCRGIKLAVDYFRERGHDKITVFVPAWRKEAPRQDTQIQDQEILYELERDGVLVFTPSRWYNNRRIVCYDDLYILKVAAEDDGIVVSNDNYRDLVNKEEYKKVIEERILMYSFVNGRFMPPDDPLGRRGPSLDNFLSNQPDLPEPLPPECPYAKKCTYGNKCKFYHPERGTMPHKSVTEKLQENARVKMKEVRRNALSRETSPGDNSGRRKSPGPSDKQPMKKPLSKTASLSQVPKQKMTLARTASLNPEGLASSSRTKQEAKPTLSVPLNDKSQAGMHRSKSSQTLSSNSSKEFQVSVPMSETNAAEKAKHYDDSLTFMRKKVEQAEAERKEKLTSRPVIIFGDGQDRTSLKPPNNWPHETLRATHSDPPNTYESSHFTCGHLSLAKKLSDEGKKEDERRNSAPFIHGLQTSPSHQPKDAASMAAHKPLARQLSLQGSEDPRVQHKLNKNVGNPTTNSRQNNKPNTVSSKPQYKLPQGVRFHQEPNPYVKFSARYFDDSSSRFSSGAAVSQHAKFSFGPVEPHQPLIRTHSYAFQSQPPTNQLFSQEHTPASRMASAPGNYPLTSHSVSNTQQNVHNYASIRRQNSSSDPQIHAECARERMLSPELGRSYPHTQWNESYGSWGTDANQDLWKYNPIQQQQQPNPCPQAYDKQQPPPQHNSPNHNRTSQGFTIGASAPFPPPTFDTTLHTSRSFEDVNREMFCVVDNPIGTIPYQDTSTSQFDRGVQVHSLFDSQHRSPEHKHQQQQHQNPQLFLSEPNIFLNPRQTGSVEGFGVSQNFPPPVRQPSLSPPSVPSPCDMFQVASGHIVGCSIPSGMMHQPSIHHFQGRPPQGPPPPHPEDQGQSSLPIPVNDQRLEIYRSLVTLFGEDKVRQVFLEHPNETQPDVLCKYIMERK